MGWMPQAAFGGGEHDGRIAAPPRQRDLDYSVVFFLCVRWL